MKKLVYGANHAFGEITTAATVNNVKMEDVKNFFSTYWKPNIAYLVFVGDIEPEKAKELAEKNFGSWAKGSVPNLSYPKPTKPAQSVIPSTVMNNILGGGFSGRLFANLREKHGFTYGAYSSLSPNRQTGIFSAESAVRNEKTDSAVQEILREINTIRNENVGENELTRMNIEI